MTDPLFELGDQPLAGCAVFQSTFPDRDHIPSFPQQSILMSGIAFTVALDFVFPPGTSRFWQAEVATMLVPMPEATVHENHRAVFGQDDVRPAGQRFVFRPVHREAVAQAMEHGAQGDLGFRIAPADARHDIATFFRCEDVHDKGIGY